MSTYYNEIFSSSEKESVKSLAKNVKIIFVLINIVFYVEFSILPVVVVVDFAEKLFRSLCLIIYICAGTLR